MLVYILLTIICIFFGFLGDKADSKKNYALYKICLIIPFLLLFIVAAIRYDVGQDYLSYMRNYELFVSGYILNNFEMGYLLFLKILSFISKNPQIVFIITSVIINYFVCKNISENSTKKWLSYIIYIFGTFFFFSMNGIRQAIAISIFYYSLKYIKEKKFNKYLFINVIGVLFHTSAITFIPLYFILQKKIKFKYIIIISMFLFGNFFAAHISNLLIQTKYSHYILNSNYYTLGKFNISSIINFLLFIIYNLFIKNKDDNDRIYENLHFIGVLISIFLPTMPLVNRFFVSFRYIEFLSVPNIIEKINIKKKNKDIIILGIVLLYTFYFIHGVYLENGNKVLPYKTFFEI